VNIGMRRSLLALLGMVSLLAASCGGEGEDGFRIVGGSERVLAEGDPAPSFHLPSAEGAGVSLDDFRGKQPVLLYFSMGPG
jgi:cytochrome oxidase Cu insertion factor (SCO1/SenC/PrrC family)